MFRSLFMILFRPGKTLDRLLDERRFGQSWGATGFLIGINALFVFFIGLYLFRFLNDWAVFDANVSNSALMILFVVGMILVLLGLIVYFVLGRFAFSWIVMLGLRISASESYPQDPAERRERARLLRLIHPYTQWIIVLPSLIFMGLFLLLFDLDVLYDAIGYDWYSGQFYPDPNAMMMMMGWFFGYLFFMLILFGMNIYMIIVRTMAIKRIYMIRTAQAFWGPFLIYFLIKFVYYIVYFGMLFVNLLSRNTSILNQI